MNLIYKGIFHIKSKKLIKNILMFLLPETKLNEHKMKIVDKKLFEMNKLYDKVNWGDEKFLNKIILLIYSAKKNYLNQNYKESRKIAFEIKRNIINSSGELSEYGKNLLLFNTEMIEIKSAIDEWCFLADNDYNSFYKDYFALTEKMLVLRNTVVNSKKDNAELIINKDYLSTIIRLNELTCKKNNGLVVSDENKKEGRVLFNKLKYFDEKIKKYKINTLSLNYNILLEKVKISFYTEEKIDKNFKIMSDFCYFCVNNYIEDPVYSALESYRKNSKKNNSFKDYLYSFKLEILKSKDKKVLFKLKKIENFIAEENERIKVIHVDSLENK